MKAVQPGRRPGAELHATLLNRHWLSSTAFEIELTKPRLFDFIPGQRIAVSHRGKERDYSLISAPADKSLGLCVKRVEEGVVSPFLAEAEAGTPLYFTGPHGYFTFKPSQRHPVFVATARVEVELTVSQKADFKIYWAQEGELYSEKMMAGIIAKPERQA